jgi:hypothetical protein
MANLWDRLFNNFAQREALIPVLKEKWQKAAFSPEPVEVKKLTKTIERLYQYLGYQPPEIRYFSSPNHLINSMLDEFCQQLESAFFEAIENRFLLSNDQIVEAEVFGKLVQYLDFRLTRIKTENFGEKIASKLENIWSNQIKQSKLDRLDQDLVKKWDLQLQDAQITQEINVLNAQHLRHLNGKLIKTYLIKLTALAEKPELRKLFGNLIDLIENQITEVVNRWGNAIGKHLFWDNCIYPETWAIANSRLEFYGRHFQLAKDLLLNQLFNDLLSQTGWILPFSKVCLIIDRPIKLTLDRENRLHQEQGMAMLYNDGYGIYAYHGVVLPKIYGEKHPDQWKAKWILTETNVELRRVLIQGIGYDRLCQELNPIELDSWREYTLLCFPELVDPIDQRPIYLLKMTCPSTGFIHGLRVPPDLTKARDAILWVNWGVDPEEIAIAS